MVEKRGTGSRSVNTCGISLHLPGRRACPLRRGPPGSGSPGPRHPWVAWLSWFPWFVLAGLLAPAGPAAAAGTVRGHARFERVKGRPELGYAELYESNLFLSPDGGTSRGPSFRLGAPPDEPPRFDGYFSLTVPAGTWSGLVNQPLFFIRPKVEPGITVRDGETVTRNIELPIDYSTYFRENTWWTSWDSVWYQTFVATGTSITGVSWTLAGTGATEIEAAVLAEGGDPNPASWPLASPRAAKRDSVGANTDNWVRWRSGEVPTVPGGRYAIRLRGTAGGDRGFAVYYRPKDARSYASGRAYSAQGAPQDFDLNITVFSDSDATAVLYNKTTEGLGALRDAFYGGRWGQTFRATAGTSLAAVDVWAAGADFNWDLDFTFRVFRGAPGGEPVGPAKTTRAAYQAFGAGLHGVSYNPGEVPLEAGETYYVEFTNPVGFNPYVMDDPADAYAGGDAYQDRSLRSGVDLSMTILVYTARGGTVSGMVRDASSRAPLAAATVTVTELGRSVLTGTDGRYELRDVPGGTWTVEAAKTGFTPGRRSGVVVVEGGSVTVDFDLEREPCGFQFRNPSFESGLAGWRRFGEGRDETVDTSGGPWFGDIQALDGDRFWGNAINGCCFERGGLYQQVCGVPGHRYRLSVWSNVYWIGGGPDDCTNRAGLDPGGGTDPDGLAVWSAPHREPRAATEGWRQLQVEAIATGPVMTLFLELRQRSAAAPNLWRINCFDLVELEDLDAALPPAFVRGDCDGSLDLVLTDGIFLLNHLFRGGTPPRCDDACDTNDDGRPDLSDAVFVFRYLYAGLSPLPPPGTDCGPDPTEDDLGCETPPCAG